MDRMPLSETNIFRDRFNSSFTFTRPSNTTQYAVGDIISNSTTAAYAFELTNCALYNGQNLDVIGATITSSVKQGTLPQMNLLIFSSPPASAVDNAAHSIADNENNATVGVIPVTTWYSSALNAIGIKDSVKIPAKCGPSVTSLYALVVAVNAYTPASEEIFVVNVSGERS